jgi:hypothetical protein
MPRGIQLQIDRTQPLAIQSQRGARDFLITDLKFTSPILSDGGGFLYPGGVPPC